MDLIHPHLTNHLTKYPPLFREVCTGRSTWVRIPKINWNQSESNRRQVVVVCNCYRTKNLIHLVITKQVSVIRTLRSTWLYPTLVDIGHQRTDTHSNCLVISTQTDSFYQIFIRPYTHSPTRDHSHCCIIMADASSSTAAPPPQTAAPPRPLQMGAKGAYIVRLLMVGDSACGKTSLVLRFDQNVFSTKFVTTIGVDYRDKMIKVGD